MAISYLANVFYAPEAYVATKYKEEATPDKLFKLVMLFETTRRQANESDVRLTMFFNTISRQIQLEAKVEREDPDDEQFASAVMVLMQRFEQFLASSYYEFEIDSRFRRIERPELHQVSRLGS